MILLFVCDVYYPCGGWDDLDSKHETWESAGERTREIEEGGRSFGSERWWQAVDLATDEVRDGSFNVRWPDSLQERR